MIRCMLSTVPRYRPIVQANSASAGRPHGLLWLDGSPCSVTIEPEAYAYAERKKNGFKDPELEEWQKDASVRCQV